MPRSRPWRRFALSALVLAAVVFFLLNAGGSGDSEDAAPEPEGPGIRPLPPPPHVDVLEEARGIYVLQTKDARYTLELRSAGRFQFLSQAGEQRRAAVGTWNLVGQGLTLQYERLNGEPFTGKPVMNVYWGDSIELLETGAQQRVILQKRTMVRGR